MMKTEERMTGVGIWFGAFAVAFAAMYITDGPQASFWAKAVVALVLAMAVWSGVWTWRAQEVQG